MIFCLCVLAKVTPCPFPAQQFRQCDIPFIKGNHTDGTLQVCMFAVHVHTKPVYSIGVHKTSLQHGCTENQFTVQVYTIQVTVQVNTKPVIVQVYTKPVYSTGVHKTSLQYK